MSAPPVTADTLDLQRALVAQLRDHNALASMMYFGPRPSTGVLSDDDVQRVAEAVCDEQERRASHPLFVSAGDRRRWLPGGGRRG